MILQEERRLKEVKNVRKMLIKWWIFMLNCGRIIILQMNGLPERNVL